MTSRQPENLPSGPLVHAFELKPLAEDETDHLIATLHPRMSELARVAVRRRCNGVPLYIEEVVAKMKEGGNAAEATEVPDTLYEALFARLRSGEYEAGAVEAAAMIGSQFDRGLLQSVLSMDDDEIDRVLEKLRDAMVLERAGDDRWRFRHELLRELAAELPPPEQAARAAQQDRGRAHIDRGRRRSGLAVDRAALSTGRPLRRGDVGVSTSMPSATRRQGISGGVQKVPFPGTGSTAQYACRPRT